MKVLLVNGSSKKKGCTATALAEVEQELNREGIETVWFHVGSQTVRGCIGCEQCHKARKGECVFGDEDGVNELISLSEECDGFVFGSPVHFAALSGSITSLLDRVFYASSKSFYYKPAACLVSCRRAGSTAALEQLLKYPSFARMPVVSSQYWNMVHGNTPDEVRQDLEGLQIMRTLGRNMAWLLQCIQAGKKAGVSYPEQEKRVATNFIR